MASAVRQESSLKIEFYNRKGGNLKEKLRVELAGLGTIGTKYDITEYDTRETFQWTKMNCLGYELYGVGEIQKFLSHYLLKTSPVTKPGITLYGELRQGDLDERDIKSIIKVCDLFPDVFLSIAFRNTWNKVGPYDLIKGKLESLGVSCQIDHLDKDKLIKVYIEEGKKNVDSENILPSMVYDGKEVTGLKNIITGMNDAIDEVVKSSKQRQLSELDKRRIKWWKEEVIARTTGIAHGDDVHEEKELQNRSVEARIGSNRNFR